MSVHNGTRESEGKQLIILLISILQQISNINNFCGITKLMLFRKRLILLRSSELK